MSKTRLRPRRHVNNFLTAFCSACGLSDRELAYRALVLNDESAYVCRPIIGPHRGARRRRRPYQRRRR